MEYKKVKPGKFIGRPNRFTAQVEIDSRVDTVHVRNTGRCREILIPETTVYLEDVCSDVPSGKKTRKTRFSLISAFKGTRLINIDSQIPNAVVAEAIRAHTLEPFQSVALLKPETVYRESRFDFYFESTTGKGFIEVKGVTLEQDGVALFPDAPTLRGMKHLYEMIQAVSEGYRGYVIFLIQMRDVKYFKPNENMDPNFAAALRKAAGHGVEILAYDSIVTPDQIRLGNPVPVKLA